MRCVAHARHDFGCQLRRQDRVAQNLDDLFKLVSLANHRDGGGIVSHADVELPAHFVGEVIDGCGIGKQHVAEQCHLA